MMTRMKVLPRTIRNLGRLSLSEDIFKNRKRTLRRKLYEYYRRETKFGLKSGSSGN